MYWRADGVVSTVSLLLGVHAERKGAGAAGAAEHLRAVALTGVAGLLAGAASMACGEWCASSVSAAVRNCSRCARACRNARKRL